MYRNFWNWSIWGSRRFVWLHKIVLNTTISESDRMDNILQVLSNNPNLTICCNSHLNELQQVLRISPRASSPLDIVCEITNSIIDTSDDTTWNIIYTMLSRGIKHSESSFQNVQLWEQTRKSLQNIIGITPHKSEVILRTVVALVEELNFALQRQLGETYQPIVPTLEQQQVLTKVFASTVDHDEIKRKLRMIYNV